jgi:hypothetical protein
MCGKRRSCFRCHNACAVNCELVREACERSLARCSSSLICTGPCMTASQPGAPVQALPVLCEQLLVVLLLRLQRLIKQRTAQRRVHVTPAGMGRGKAWSGSMTQEAEQEWRRVLLGRKNSDAPLLTRDGYSYCVHTCNHIACTAVSCSRIKLARSSSQADVRASLCAWWPPPTCAGVSRPPPLCPHPPQGVSPCCGCVAACQHWHCPQAWGAPPEHRHGGSGTAGSALNTCSQALLKGSTSTNKLMVCPDGIWRWAMPHTPVVQCSTQPQRPP